MGNRSKKRSRAAVPGRPPVPATGDAHDARLLYDRACRLAQEGDHAQARSLFERVDQQARDVGLRALARNDLATLLAVRGDSAGARAALHEALALDPACGPARANLACLDGPEVESTVATTGPVPEPSHVVTTIPPAPAPGCKVALVSFLFNWPSTGGGNVHTFELTRFLAKAGYDARLFYARHAPWGIGHVPAPLPFASEALDFDEGDWRLDTILGRYRRAVDGFRPDYVIVTDSWSIKPLLAEALGHYPYFLRFQAMECICPLNGVRFLTEPGGRFHQCRLHQPAHPQDCRRCLQARGRQAGQLHQAERILVGVDYPEYHGRLLRALQGAEAVLVVNPLTEVLLAPYARSVRVVTAGIDPARFPWPGPDDSGGRNAQGRLQIFFAGLVHEGIKGFHVAQEACALLWRRRQDFELVATGDPPGRFNEFTRFVGWLSQEELPRHLRAAACLVMPTVAQEALGRTAVEAMAAGLPVVASRLGGLPFTVLDGETGFLVEPGNPGELARALELLLDDRALRLRLGAAGRRRFEEHYSWDVIIDRHYRPLLAARDRVP